MRLEMPNRKAYSASIGSTAVYFLKADIKQILAYMSNSKVL